MAFKKVEHFEKINRSKMVLKEAHKRTRTGAWKTATYTKGHGKHYKH